MDENELLAFRSFLAQLDTGGCLACGMCCIGFSGNLLLEAEARRITDAYGEEYFLPQDHTTSTLVLPSDGAFCAWLGDRPALDANIKLLIEHDDTDTREAEFEQHHLKVPCSIYDERPIICRVYPAYPFSGNCPLISDPFLVLDATQRTIMERYALDYITTLRREIVTRSGICDRDDYRPAHCGGLVWLDEQRVSHTDRATRRTHPFWSIWSYIRSVELEAWEAQFLRRCDGTRSLTDLAAHLDIDLAQIRETVRTFFVYSLLKLPEGMTFTPVREE